MGEGETVESVSGAYYFYFDVEFERIIGLL
jgi:hypothetical protein